MSEVSLAGRIRRWREHRGLSRGTLATAIGVAYVTVWRYESGAAVPSAHQLERIASVLGTTMPTFYGPLPEPEQPADAAAADGDPAAA